MIFSAIVLVPEIQRFSSKLTKFKFFEFETLIPVTDSWYNYFAVDLVLLCILSVSKND